MPPGENPYPVTTTSTSGKPALVPYTDTTAPVDGAPHSLPPVPPTVPGLTKGANGEVVVNTALLRSFADYLGRLVPPLQEAQRQLRLLDPRPGGFYQAFQLRTKIGSDDASGLRGSYDRLIARIIETLTDVKNGVLKMANDYETTEQINGATADQLLKRMPDVAGDIASLNALLGATGSPKA